MIFLLESDELAASSIRGVLHGPVERIDTSVEIRRRLESAPPSTIVIGPNVPEPTALDVASQVRVSHPSVGVIVIRPRLDTATLTAVMRAGARDAIAAHDVDKLADRVAASEATTRAIRGEEANVGEGARTARIVTVYSPKGGAGKTTVATNLACALAALDQRVVVLDFDLAFGDVALDMGLVVKHHVGEAKVGLVKRRQRVDHDRHHAEARDHLQHQDGCRPDQAHLLVGGADPARAGIRNRGPHVVDPPRLADRT